MEKREKSPKAAIITWCYDNGKTNYGQILQCYAMQTLLRRFRYQTKVVRYRKKNLDEQAFIKKYPKIFIDIYELWYRLRKVEKEIDLRIIRFIMFIRKNILLSEQCYSREEVEKECSDCEVLVCGSDQIWNPIWFQDIYALNFGKKTQKRISYAPSGVAVENENNKEIYIKLGKYLEKFDLITVREKKSVEILKKYTSKKILDVLDPTLLLTQDDWNKVAVSGYKTKDSYIFCYSLGKLRSHKVLLKHIMKKYGAKKIYFIVSGFYENENELEKGGYFYPVKNAGPAQFLTLIRDACAICTDSFHGVALSIVYNKQFFVLKREDTQANLNANYVRQENLLEKVKIDKARFVRCILDVEKVEEINYAEVELKRYWEEVKELLQTVL